MAKSDATVEQACANYGQALGTAFQIIDDVLDYDGAAVEMGKNLGDDLREGKATLPLIAAMQRASAAESEVIKSAIEHGRTEQLEEIVRIVRDTGALEVARACAAAEAERAIASISSLTSSPYKSCLVQLAAQLLGRRT